MRRQKGKSERAGIVCPAVLTKGGMLDFGYASGKDGMAMGPVSLQNGGFSFFLSYERITNEELLAR